MKKKEKPTEKTSSSLFPIGWLRTYLNLVLDSCFFKNMFKKKRRGESFISHPKVLNKSVTVFEQWHH